MTGEVEVAQRPLAPDNDMVVSLVAKAQEMDAAWQIATRLADTAFVPTSYRGKVAETAAAIITGNELGLPLMAALRSIDVIDGTPALRANTLRALILKAGHEIWVDESNEHRAVVKGRRSGTDHIEVSIWDDARAQKAGLSSKKNYQTHPGSMYIARGTADVARRIAPDVILGLPYAAEEVEDEEFDRADEAPTAKRTTTRTARKPLPEKAPAAEPDLPEEEALTGAAGASQRSAATQAFEAEQAAPITDEDEDKVRLAEEALAEEARLNAAAAFADGPVDESAPLSLEEPAIDWEGPQ